MSKQVMIFMETVLYMEPLLRWLQVGGRGYRHSCIPNQNNVDTHLCNTLNSAAFADDLLCPTGTVQNLKIQAQKLSLLRLGIPHHLWQ